MDGVNLASTRFIDGQDAQRLIVMSALDVPFMNVSDLSADKIGLLALDSGTLIRNFYRLLDRNDDAAAPEIHDWVADSAA